MNNDEKWGLAFLVAKKVVFEGLDPNCVECELGDDPMVYRFYTEAVEELRGAQAIQEQFIAALKQIVTALSQLRGCAPMQGSFSLN